MLEVVSGRHRGLIRGTPARRKANQFADSFHETLSKTATTRVFNEIQRIGERRSSRAEPLVGETEDVMRPEQKRRRTMLAPLFVNDRTDAELFVGTLRLACHPKLAPAAAASKRRLVDAGRIELPTSALRMGARQPRKHLKR
jgi:hypothetical protein